MDEMNVGFGMDSQSDIANLQKALAVGYEHGVTDQTGFGATRLQSLEKTMKYAVEEEKASKFFLAIRKSKGESTVEEYTKFNNLGDAGFYTEGGLPEQYDEDISREFEVTRYVGAVGKVPYVALSVKSQVNNEAMIMKAKATAIIRKCNQKLFFGNSNNVSVEWNGFLEQFTRKVKEPTQNVIDLRGKVLTPEILSNACQVIAGNWGDPENIKAWISNEAFNGYAKEMIKNKYMVMNGGAVNDITVVPKTFKIAHGGGNIETDIHLNRKGQAYTDAPHPKLTSSLDAFAYTNSLAPSVPTASASVDADATSLLSAGTFDYAVVPVNKYGAGIAVAVTSVSVSTTGKKVTLTITDGVVVAESYDIYRKNSSDSALTSYRYLTTFKKGATVVDNGADLPDTQYGFIFDWNFDQVLDFKQLLPMVRMDLATIDDSKRWLQKLYGTPLLYNANKMVLVKNIGTASW